MLELTAAAAQNTAAGCGSAWACTQYAATTQAFYRLPDCPLAVSEDDTETYMPLDNKAIWSKDYLQGFDLSAAPGVTLAARFRQRWRLTGWSHRALVAPFVPFALVAPLSDSYNVTVSYAANNSTAKRKLAATNVGAPWDNAFRMWLEATSWGSLKLRMSMRDGATERVLTHSAAGVSDANALSLAACPAGSWSTVAVTLQRGGRGGGGAAVVTAACDATRSTARAEVALASDFWIQIPSKAFMLLGASGRGYGLADSRTGWFDHPSDSPEALATTLTGAGDLAAAAVYPTALASAQLASVMQRVGVAEVAAATQQPSCPCNGGDASAITGVTCVIAQGIKGGCVLTPRTRFVHICSSTSWPEFVPKAVRRRATNIGCVCRLLPSAV